MSYILCLLVLLDSSLDKHHLPFSLSPSSLLHIFIYHRLWRVLDFSGFRILSAFWWFRRV